MTLCILKQHQLTWPGKLLSSVPKRFQLKGSAAKTGAPPEWNTISYLPFGLKLWYVGALSHCRAAPHRRCEEPLYSQCHHVIMLSYTLHPTPYTPYTLHPTPYTPTPYTLHPTPYTLHPTYTLVGFVRLAYLLLSLDWVRGRGN